MSAWLPVLPALLLTGVLLVVPGLVVGYAGGARGLAAWGLAPTLSMSVLGVGAAAASLLGLPWSPGLLAASTVVGGLLAYLVEFAVRRAVPRWRETGGQEPRRTGWFALAAVVTGSLLVLAAALPGIGSPDELVDSTDAVAHLNRLRRFLESADFSSLGGPGHPAYPSAFHDLGGTLAQLVPGLAQGPDLVVVANLTALSAAAFAWPLGAVALSRLVLGRSGVVLLGAGLVSAAFTAFPYLLMGWGVLWPNLLGTALLPGVLGPALVVLGVVSPVPGLGRRTASLMTLAALPGLTLAHPNALVSLVFVAVLAGGTRLFLRWRLLTGVPARRSGVALVGLVLVVVTGLLAVPRISRQVADTASYDWGASDPLGASLRDSVLLGIQVGPLPWGLLALVVVGIVVAVRRVRLRWVVVAWLGCVALFLVAATGRPGFGSLVTGYWYNDKVRLAALLVVPASLLAVAGVQAISRLLAVGLRTFSPLPVERTRVPWAGVGVSAAGALLVALSVTGGASHDQASGMVDRYYHPDHDYQVLVTADDVTALSRLAALIPVAADGGTPILTADVPANGSGFFYAFDGRPVLFESLLLDPDPDHALIGLSLKDAATRTDVCDALRRDNIRYAITGADRYWLDLSTRTVGIADLDGTSGFERIGTAGRYTLFRIQACGFDPGWLPPAA